MQGPETDSGLPSPLRAYIGLVASGGLGLAVLLALGQGWGTTVLAEAVLMTALAVVAGSFPLHIAPRVKADVTSAVFFGAALLLEPGAAAVVGAAGITIYTLLIRFWGEKLHLPWYKYPFNAAETALVMGLTSLLFHELSPGTSVLTVAVVPAAAAYYLLDTWMVSVAASLQIKVSPVRIWWTGSRDNGPAELAQVAFGFLGALAYYQSPWTIPALFIPVAAIYFAFSRLASANSRLQTALEDLENLQGRIVSTAKLASIGAISLDLAHQIKNPLAILLGRLEEVLENLPRDSKARRHANIASEAGWRIQELTQTFASIGKLEWLPLDVRYVLDEAMGMAALKNGKPVNTQRTYDQASLFVRGNPILIREALSNVFANSLEAVSDGGTVSIHALRVNGSVVMRISDNGPGIPEQTLEHLFQPFFTTKPHGYGLGLFACKHIFEMHNGSVDVETQRGAGTVVVLSLPADAADDRGEGGEGGKLVGVASR